MTCLVQLPDTDKYPREALLISILILAALFFTTPRPFIGLIQFARPLQNIKIPFTGILCSTYILKWNFSPYLFHYFNQRTKIINRTCVGYFLNCVMLFPRKKMFH